jgi:hypothetical protein
VKAFSCGVCGNALYFENSVCVACGTRLGFSREQRAIVPVSDAGEYVDTRGRTWHVCRNLAVAACTWLTEVAGDACFSCRLTRTRPHDGDAAGLKAFKIAEEAKRRLVVDLDSRGFPIVPRTEDRENGLAFDLLSSVDRDVTTGHKSGIITLDLAEGDDAHREKVRIELAEPYRTMLGHFRHEVGHYIEWQHVRGDLIERARELFGNEEQSYSDAIERHYSDGPPEGWEQSYISMYATMHPFEDFAETFAHYLHISDTIETAVAHGLASLDAEPGLTTFRDLVVTVWMPLSIALNQINRSMGKGALYPFVIPPPVLDKLQFVSELPPTQNG